MTQLLPEDAGRLIVRLDSRHQPVSFVWEKRLHVIRRVVNEWRVDDGWWHRPLSRHYYQVITTSGWLVIFYWDRFGRTWHLERLHD